MSFQSSYPTERTGPYEGMLADGHPHVAISMVNKEASAAMYFGCAVAFEGSTDDQGALAPDATSDVIAGLLIHQHYPDSALNAAKDGVAVDQVISVLRKGRIWARCEDGCSPGDRLFIRAVATGSEREGECAKAADASDMINSTNQGVWLTTAAAGEVALLEVDFTNHPNPNP